MIRILLVEDNDIVRKGLTMLLGKPKDMEVTATACNAYEALDLLKKQLIVDLILTDLNMPGMDGIEMISHLPKCGTVPPVAILTMHVKSSFVDRAITAGAKGFLLKGENFEELYDGIRMICGGAIYISPGAGGG